MTELNQFATVVSQYVPELSPNPALAPGFSFLEFENVKLDNCRVYSVVTEDSSTSKSSTVRLVRDTEESDACRIELHFTRTADAAQFPVGKRVSITID